MLFLQGVVVVPPKLQIYLGKIQITSAWEGIKKWTLGSKTLRFHLWDKDEYIPDGLKPNYM